MTRSSSINEIELIDLVNLEIGAHLAFDDYIVYRDSYGYLVGVIYEDSFDCCYRSENAESAIETIESVLSGVSLKYYCDSEMIYLGTVGLPVDRSDDETLEQAVSRVAGTNRLAFVEMGEEQKNLFNSFFPVLVTRSSFEQVLHEQTKEEGRRVLQDFFDKAVFDISDKLAMPWSVFPEGTRKQPIYEWVINRYQLEEEDAFQGNQDRSASTGASQC
tara:strand:- start:2173 stop:2823 length:651 start_codon:yes stop_codon:yes gene_type:complete